MECFCRRGFMEIEIASENLIGTLARQYHLDTHRLDDTRQQIHRSRGTHGGNIVGFNKIDHITDGVEPLLDGIVDFMMHSTDMVGHHSGLRQVGSPFQSYSKGMQTWPICLGLRTILNAHFGKSFGNGRNHR